MDDSETVIRVTETYPEFRAMYSELYMICQNTEKVMEMFSQELMELDRNTVQYMIDEMQEKIDSQGDMLEERDNMLLEKDNMLQERDNTIDSQRDMLQERDNTIESQRSQIADLLLEIERLKRAGRHLSKRIFRCSI